MSKSLEEILGAADQPRPLDPAFRIRLEESLISGSPAAASDLGDRRWTFDRPRAMPDALRARLQTKLVTPNRHLPRFVTTSVAVAAVIALIANAVVIGARRTSPVAPGSTVAMPLDDPKRTPPSGVVVLARRPPGSLQTFASEGDFLRYVRSEALKLVGPSGLGEGEVILYSNATPLGRVVSAPSAASAVSPSRSFSSTNIQERGVDELDVVKTDGRRLITLERSRVWIFGVDDGIRLLGSLKIGDEGQGLFLAGDRVIHVGSTYREENARRAKTPRGRAWTKVTIIDIAQPSAPRIVTSLSVEGAHVGARMVDGVLRLVLRSSALGPEPVPLTDASPSELSDATAANKLKISTSDVGDWVPHYILDEGLRTSVGHLHDWSAVVRPPDRAGVGMLTVLTLDPVDPKPSNVVSVVGSGEVVYATPGSLYVTSSTLDQLLALRTGKPVPAEVTRIHKFDISDPARTVYVASGEVAGHPLNQFSLSERDDVLRVATTLGGGDPSSNLLTTLRLKAGRLAPIGRLGNLARGERIYSVRFIGTKAYVVTFRQIDPLHVIDLRDPAHPRLTGELKVPGYSGYLHPVGEDRLIGVGQDGDEQGRMGGVAVSLFDVSDPARPTRIDAETFGAAGHAEAMMDHHAFLYFQPRKLLVVPATFAEDASQSRLFTGAVAMTVSPFGFGPVTRLSHAFRSGDTSGPSIRRAFVLDGRLVTMSSEGLLVSDLATFADRGWIPFE